MKRPCVWVISVALMMSGVMLAHEGHAHKVMGTVSMVHENHVEVKDVKGKVTTVTLGGKTKIRRGKAVATLADIKVGDRVVVTTVETKDKAGKAVVTVTQVELGVAAATAAGKK